MKQVQFKVNGIQGKQRPRFVNGHTYTPRETVFYEEKVAVAYEEAGGEMFDKDIPLKVEIEALFEIPASYSKKRRKEIHDNMERPMKKPDLDNIAKIVLDGLNGIAYEDDKQVVTVKVSKHYTDFNSCIYVYVIDETR